MGTARTQRQALMALGGGGPDRHRADRGGEVAARRDAERSGEIARCFRAQMLVRSFNSAGRDCACALSAEHALLARCPRGDRYVRGESGFNRRAQPRG